MNTTATTSAEERVARTAASASGPVVIGLGSPLLTDDTVGLRVVEALQQGGETEFPGVTFTCLHNVGLELLDELDGHAAALFVDCIRTDSAAPGHCHELSIDDLQHTVQSRLVDSHGLSLATIVAMGARMGYRLPTDIRILGIEGRRLYEFAEEPTPEVRAGMGACIERARGILRQWSQGPVQTSLRQDTGSV
jgi:hydrogenase maturation protease